MQSATFLPALHRCYVLRVVCGRYHVLSLLPDGFRVVYSGWDKAEAVRVQEGLRRFARNVEVAA